MAVGLWQVRGIYGGIYYSQNYYGFLSVRQMVCLPFKVKFERVVESGQKLHQITVDLEFSNTEANVQEYYLEKKKYCFTK